MKRLLIILLLLFPLALGAKKKNYMIIRKGDTLWSISRKYKVPLSTLYAINRLTPRSRIRAGDRILLFTESRQPRLSLKLARPVEGEVYTHFNQGQNLVQKNGIEFRTGASASVKSATAGTVKYTGGLRGYGNVVIIEHSTNISLVYAFLDRIMVKSGERVETRQTIGTVGKNNFCEFPILHFELFHRGNAVNPVKYFY